MLVEAVGTALELLIASIVLISAEGPPAYSRLKKYCPDASNVRSRSEPVPIGLVRRQVLTGPDAFFFLPRWAGDAEI